MIKEFLKYLIRKLVTFFYKKYDLYSYSWSVDEETEICIESYYFGENVQRYGVMKTPYVRCENYCPKPYETYFDREKYEKNTEFREKWEFTENLKDFGKKGE